MRSVLLLLLATGTAAATPLTPPAGWTLDRAATGRMVPGTRLPATGTLAVITVEVWKPDKSGAVLYTTTAEAEVPADRRDAIASAELGELAEQMHRQGAGVVAEATAQRADPTAKQLESSVKWRDPKAGLVTSARLVIATAPGKLVLAKAECVLAADTDPAIGAACDQALATLASAAPPAERMELAIVAAAPPEPPPAARTADQPRLGDPGHVGLPPMPVAPAPRDADRRPVYVGFGLIVMAAIFYWNRRRRERFEREDSGAPPRTEDDADADDLHAAATKSEKDQP